MTKEQLIVLLEARLEDYRMRHFANKGLHLDARASEIATILEMLKE